MRSWWQDEFLKEPGDSLCVTASARALRPQLLAASWVQSGCHNFCVRDVLFWLSTTFGCLESWKSNICVSEDISRDWLCRLQKRVEITWVTSPNWPRTWTEQKAKAGRILHHGRTQVFLSFWSFVAALMPSHQCLESSSSKYRFLLATLQGASKSSAPVGPMGCFTESLHPHPQARNSTH